MNKKELIQRLKLEYIRRREARQGSAALLEELEASIKAGCPTVGLLQALNDEYKNNELKLEMWNVFAERAKAQLRKQDLLEIFGDLLPLCLPQLGSPIDS